MYQVPNVLIFLQRKTTIASREARQMRNALISLAEYFSGLTTVDESSKIVTEILHQISLAFKNIAPSLMYGSGWYKHSFFLIVKKIDPTLRNPRK